MPSRSSFLTVKIIQRLGAEDGPLGRVDQPLLTVGIIAGLADRIVGDNIENQIPIAVGEQLMGLLGPKEKRIEI